MTKEKELKYLLLIITTFIAACIETDLYLPAFPNMMKAFSVSEEAIQSLLTWNFVEICIAGPLSDSFGLVSFLSPQDLYFSEAMEILPHIKGVTASLITSILLLPLLLSHEKKRPPARSSPR